MSLFALRPWKDSDLNSLCRHANNIKISGMLTNRFPHPYTEEVGQKFIQMANSSNPILIFCIEVDQEAAGGIGIHPQDDIFFKNAELGYWLAECYWGRGIISSAINQITNYAFENLSIDRIFARPFGTNMASQKALEKNGFVLEARLKETIYKNGNYQDELIYGLRRKSSEKI